MKLKQFLLTLLAVLLLFAGTASADSFTISLGNQDYSGDMILLSDNIGTIIYQSVSTSGLENGLEFTESGFLTCSEVITIGNAQGEDIEAYLYLGFDDLSGYITNVTTDPVSDLPTYDIVFYPTDSIYLYLGSDTGTLIETIAEFSLTSGSGTGFRFTANYQQANSFSFDLNWDWVADGIFSFTNSGISFEDWMDEDLYDYGITSTIWMGTYLTNPGVVPEPADYDEDGDYEMAIEVRGSGHILDITATPEPATLILLGVGLLGLAGIGRKNSIKE